MSEEREPLPRLAAAERFITAFGRLSGWIAVPLMLVIVFDVLLRRWFVIGSTQLQELEWHLHGLLFLLTIGAAYLRGAHVRIDLLRERMTLQTRSLIEFFGLALLLLPFCSALLWFGFDYAALAFAAGETSPSPGGLPARWIIKSALFLGIALLFSSGLVRFLRSGFYLFGSPALRRQLIEVEEAMLASHVDDDRT